MNFRICSVLLVPFLLLVQALFAGAPDVMSAELKPETTRGFLRYAEATEARIRDQVAHPDTFLYIDKFPEPRRSQVRDSVKRGEVFIQRLETRDGSGNVIEAPHGLIHHWIGAVFIPGAS